MDGIIAGGEIGGQQNNAKFDYLPPLQRQIMIFVHNAPPTNEGVHVQTIAQAIQTPSATVMHAVEQLTTDGQLYTTIDDDHVRLYPLITDTIGEKHGNRLGARQSFLLDARLVLLLRVVYIYRIKG
jgi:Replication protein A C terminal